MAALAIRSIIRDRVTLEHKTTSRLLWIETGRGSIIGWETSSAGMMTAQQAGGEMDVCERGGKRWRERERDKREE